jgi:hypothetical protein
MSNSDIEAKIEALPPNEDLKFLNRVSGYYKKSDLTTDDLKTLVSQLREARQERKDAAIEAARTALTKCANEMGLPVSAFPFSEVFSEMFPGESIEEK